MMREKSRIISGERGNINCNGGTMRCSLSDLAGIWMVDGWRMCWNVV